MHGIPLLRDLVILVAVAIPVVIIMSRLRIPTLVGFLLTGILIGPSALGLVGQLESVSVLAEVGAVLLLFAVGLELSLSSIVRLGGAVLKGGGLQMAGTASLFAGGALVLGVPMTKAWIFGLLIGLSSTAIILKIYAGRQELDAAHGRVVVAILLFQDLCVVPLMMLIPLLAGTADGVSGVIRGVVMTMVVTGALLAIGRYMVPWLLERVVSLRNNELFTLCVLALGLGAAYVTSSFGLSLALGAFLAGLLIAESDYGLQALSDVLPFRDTFSGIFFISVGMLLDVRYVAANALEVIGLALAVVTLKALIGYFVVRWVRRSQRVGIIAGLGIAQVGEFSFVLAGSALGLGLLSAGEYQLFLGAAVATMLLAPFLVEAAPEIAERLLSYRSMPTMEFATREARAVKPLDNHVIIVGYGLNGRNTARALRRAGIQYAIIEANGQVVRKARLEREPVFFGDGTRAEVLERVGIGRARVVVFCLASAADERRAVAGARHLNPAVHIVTRTRYVAEIEELHRLGANEVVPEEFETSLEISARVMRQYGVPDEKIRQMAADIRQAHYEMLRRKGAAGVPIDEILGR
ncbi:MAG: cation:proton antiporter [Gemmatimonadota bacterium]